MGHNQVYDIVSPIAQSSTWTGNACASWWQYAFITYICFRKFGMFTVVMPSITVNSRYYKSSCPKKKCVYWNSIVLPE